MPNKYDYDAIIIGAGISGLVCGCYLAKSGMKTLIVEKNTKPGGYCTPFKRGGFHFDACAHSLGSFRDGGNISNILKELDIYEQINIIRFDPSDIIVSPDCRISFWNDLEKTIYDFQEKFPREASQVKHFFQYIDNNSGSALITKLRNKTFKDLLDLFFKDIKLKAFLSLPVLGNVGLPPSLASALTAATIYKEFIYDGGNYPEGGMQELPNILMQRLKELGGEILLSKEVQKIKIKNKSARGVRLNNNDDISANYVVSNVDARNTFLKMVNHNVIDKDMHNKLETLIPSLSMFILYLGVDGDFNGLPDTASNIWILPHYDIEKMYITAMEGDIDNSDWLLLRASKDKKNILILVNAAYKTKDYWKKNKKRLTNLFIKKVEKIIPKLSKHIVFKDAATPHTLYRFTLNSNGAAYGWAGMSSQFAVRGFTQTTLIKNLYLTGHWTTIAQGISGVSYLGRSTARMILMKERSI